MRRSGFSIAALSVLLLVGRPALGQPIQTGSAGGRFAPRGGEPAYPLCTGTERVSVSSEGVEGNGTSDDRPSVSADGRFVSFQSIASNLVPNDTNSTSDVFVHDRWTGETVRVSVNSSGEEGDDWTGVGRGWSLSSEGRFVAFSSAATNLVPDDTNALGDCFVHDRDSDVNGVFDEPGGTATTRASLGSAGQEGDSWSDAAVVSANGEYVVFHSNATNLVVNDTNANTDIFVRDLNAQLLVRVSVDSSGQQANAGSNFSAISCDGRMIAFLSWASNLVPDDTNNQPDVFVHDRDADGNGVFDELGGIETRRVSVGSQGEQGDGRAIAIPPAISADGRLVVFSSESTNLVVDDTNGFADTFVHDVLTGVTRRVSVTSEGTEGNGLSYGSSISGDGRYVTFRSEAGNLVPDDFNEQSDIFRHDLITGQTIRISLSTLGDEANGFCGFSVITADGGLVAFRSEADNLVPSDTNGVSDMFVRCILASDFDGDGDVDLDDFEKFNACFAGPDNPPAGTCSEGIDADLDNDGDVDLADFKIFQLSFTGP